MKKTAILTFASALSTLLLIGCSATAPAPEVKSGHQSVEAQKHERKVTRHAIEKAGEKAGWRMTKFRGNALIAEKDGKVVTVEFDKTSFHTNPKDSSLENAIEDALENVSEH